MKRQPDLNNIGVIYKNGKIKEYRNESEFVKSLSVLPLSEIERINIKYELNLGLKPLNSSRWSILKNGGHYASFNVESTDQKDFIKNFEENLIREFIYNNTNTEPEARVDM